MKKSVVIAEKPSVGRDISRVLGCQKKSNGYMENNQYIVTWALGHLVTLATPERYNKAYDSWELNTLPMIPNPFKLEVIKNTSRQYSQVRKLLEREDVGEIIIATDAGREGELVARWIIEYAHCKKPIKRLWISSVTDRAIKDGFKHLKNGNQYDHLYYAARARAKADWIVGLNGTRALTCKHNASLSMGRVQTPTLALLNDREKEIIGFKPKNYYEIITIVNGLKCKWVDKQGGQTRIFSKEKAEGIIQKCRQKSGTISAIHESVKKSYKTGFYDLTELQRDANRLYNFSAKETLNTMQSLYERHKVLTYPRTDSKYITKDVVETLKDRVEVCRFGDFKGPANQILKSPIKGNASYVNDAKVGDHHGIIPTEEPAFIADFSPKELKIYSLVVKRFLSVLLPPYQYKEVAFEVTVEGESFKGKGSIDMDLGWKMLYTKEPEAIDEELQKGDKDSFNFKKGDSVNKIVIKMEMAKTTPPSYFTEGELLHQMEKSGLGTVATRADIIEKIVDKNYVDKQERFLRVTKTGKQLLQLVPEDLRSKELTARWEKDLEAIASGKKSEKVFMEEMVQFTHKIVGEIKRDDGEFKHDNISSEICPDCGKKLLVVENKYGKKLECRDRACGYRKNISKATNARCPNCHKKLSLVGEGDNKTFVCKCGYKEKLESFNKKRETRKQEMSKGEVKRYMNKTDKQAENFNNPFANLLKDMEK
jgi:DNA topoisomerase-3